MHDLKKQQQFIWLRARGQSLRQSASLLDVSKTTATRWNRRLKGEIKRVAEDPADLILSSFGLHRDGRLAALGEIVSLLRQKIAAKAPAELSNKDLDSYVRLSQLLEKEETRRKAEARLRKEMGIIHSPLAGGAGDDVYYISRAEVDDNLNFEDQYEEIDIRGTELEQRLEDWCGDRVGISETVRIPDEVMKRYGVDPKETQSGSGGEPPPLAEFLAAAS